MYIQLFCMEVNWRKIWHLVDVSTMFYICRYCVFTLWRRSTGWLRLCSEVMGSKSDFCLLSFFPQKPHRKLGLTQKRVELRLFNSNAQIIIVIRLGLHKLSTCFIYPLWHHFIIRSYLVRDLPNCCMDLSLNSLKRCPHLQTVKKIIFCILYNPYFGKFIGIYFSNHLR